MRDYIRSFIDNNKKAVNDVCFLYSGHTLLEIAMISSVLIFTFFYWKIPHHVIAKISVPISIILLTLLAFLLGSYLHASGLYKFLKDSKAVNLLDVMLLEMLLISLSLFFLTVVVIHDSTYTVGGFLLWGTISFPCAKWFCRRANVRATMETQSYAKLYDLKDIYDNKVSYKKGEPILVDEKDVDYDLFHREHLQTELFQAITSCKSEHSFAISLEGPWGSGKTTIINNVKKRLELDQNDDILTADLDPWLYGNQEALLQALYETLIKKCGFQYSPIQTQRKVHNLSKVILESDEKGKLLYSIFGTVNSEESIKKLKKHIQYNLEMTGKRLVVFIDNLDRASDQNVVLIFKLISLIFDLPGVIYVITFEKDRIEKVLKKNQEFDYRFIEKIIQREIKMPAMDDMQIRRVYKKIMLNLLRGYGVKKGEMESYRGALRYIIRRTDSMRIFKRMVNTVLTTVFVQPTKLYVPDLLALEAIRFFESDLYKDIWRNSNYYTSLNCDGDKIWHKEVFNEQAKKYFSFILENYPEEKDILMEIFPYVKRYIGNVPLEADNGYTDPEDKKRLRQMRICDRKYFDLYFSYGVNEYISVSENLKAYFSEIKECTTVKKAITITETHIDIYHQSEWLKELQLKLAEVSAKQAYFILWGLFESEGIISDETLFLDLSARSRSRYIVLELLLKINETDYDAFLSELKDRYDKVEYLSDLIYWLKDENYEYEEFIQNRMKKLEGRHSELCLTIVDKQVNLFNETYYDKSISFGLLHFFEQENRPEAFKKYVLECLSNDTICRVINEMITHEVAGDHEHIYSIQDETVGRFFDDTAVLDSLLVERPAKSESEEFIYRVYDNYKNGVPNYMDEKNIVEDYDVNIQL